MLYSSLGLGCFGFRLGLGLLLGLGLVTFRFGHLRVCNDFVVVIPDGLDRFAEPLDADARFVNL